MRLFVGIDTSAYTTSLCVLAENGSVMAEARQVLDVPMGKLGLQQSVAVFQHLKNLPLLAEKINKSLPSKRNIEAICASTQPRPLPGSYMPVFVPGASFGASLANLSGVPFFELSHQESHIFSGIKTVGGPLVERFLAIHLSGGTTEMCIAERGDDYRLAIEVCGSTSDLHAGQFVDRVGNELGMPFPAGASLDALAQRVDSYVPVPTSHKNGLVSFSGPLTALQKKIKTASSEEIARGLFEAISRTLLKWIRWAEKQTDCRMLVIVGGVAANSIIRRRLVNELTNWQLFFADPKYSTDNALGNAFYAGLASGYIKV